MWNMVVSRRRWSAFALLLTLTGCTTLNDCKYELGQKIRTKQAWHEFDGCHTECFTVDYKNGWKAGYYDVATGGSGCPPVVAPKEYWKPPVFCEYDPSRRDDWYCGFLDGAACGKCEPNHHYLQTYLPPAVCCPVQTVCCPEVMVEEPEMFPMEHIHGDAALESTNGEAPVPVESAPMPAREQPSATPSSDQKSSAEEYEKDPAAPNPETAPAEQTEPSDATSLLQRLIQQSQQKQVSSPRKSLVQQLVLNAGHSTTE